MASFIVSAFFWLLFSSIVSDTQELSHLYNKKSKDYDYVSLFFLFLGGIIIDDFDSDLKTRKMNNQQSGVLRKQEYFNKRLRYYIINLRHITHKPWCIAYFIGYMWIFVAYLTHWDRQPIPESRSGSYIPNLDNST